MARKSSFQGRLRRRSERWVTLRNSVSKVLARHQVGPRPLKRCKSNGQSSHGGPTRRRACFVCRIERVSERKPCTGPDAALFVHDATTT
jgi:hypothetical protein